MRTVSEPRGYDQRPDSTRGQCSVPVFAAPGALADVPLVPFHYAHLVFMIPVLFSNRPRE